MPSPLIAIIMGSSSDWDTMSHAATTLDQLSIPYETKVVSAHRTPDLLMDFAASAESRGIEVIIAGAGGAAHLPGMAASKTVLPVLGVPVESASLKGMDSLLSIAQMPGGIPVGTLAIDLTPYAFTLDDATIPLGGSPSYRPFIGDYMNSVDVRGCQVIAGYIAPPEEGGAVGVFVTFALIPNSSCVVDANCYVNCDGTTSSPVLSVNDFLCFIERYAAGESWANCDGSTGTPALTANDFQCYLNKYTAGCT